MSELHKKSSPVGVDVAIQQLQCWFNTNLPTTWNINANTYASYGRVYENERGDEIIPEVNIGGNEYKEVKFDDTYKVGSYFVVDDINADDMNTAIIRIVFWGDLSKLSAVTHRGDEEIRQDIVNILKKEPYGFKVVGMGNAGDMQPRFVMEFTCELIYNNYTSC